MKYAERYRVSRASRKCKRSRSYLSGRRSMTERWNLWPARVGAHTAIPNQHTETQRKQTRDMRRRNPDGDGKAMASSETAGLYPSPGKPVSSRVMRKLKMLAPVKEKRMTLKSLMNKNTAPEKFLAKKCSKSGNHRITFS